jgi:biofilm PGA synthesis N-glycosyltransferase PgaC
MTTIMALAVDDFPIRTVIITFLCVHPLGSALMALFGAIAFRSRADATRWFEPSAQDAEQAKARFPTISVVIPSYDEESVVGEAIHAATLMRWPDVDVIVVDDASDDGTSEVARSYLDRDLGHAHVRLLRKADNEGKSMATNDALALCRGKLVLVLDADGVPAADVLERMVPHFLRSPRLGAVTGNPRVINTRTLLARVQAIEFSCTVGVQRRGDAVWGRLMTFSGMCTLLDRDALLALGGYAPDMATEDIDLTWRLQLAGRDVAYEPTALFGMQAPERIGAWWRQRKRWATGLAQVLRRHSREALGWRNWRMWPIFAISTLSIIWAHLLALSLFLTLLDVIGVRAIKVPPILMGWWAALTLVCGIVQALVGIWLDRRYDPALKRQWPWVAVYPLYYWVLCCAAVVRATVPALLRRPAGLSTWHIAHDSDAVLSRADP